MCIIVLLQGYADEADWEYQEITLERVSWLTCVLLSMSLLPLDPFTSWVVRGLGRAKVQQARWAVFFWLLSVDEMLMKLTLIFVAE